MAESRGNLDPFTVLPGGCFAQWREGLPCPNEWEGVIENLKKPGYAQFCGAHMSGYSEFNHSGEGVTWRARTRAAWEASGRKAMLDAAISGRSS